MERPRESGGASLAMLAAAAVGLAQLAYEVAAAPPDTVAAGRAVLAVLALHALLGALAFAVLRPLVRGPRAVALLAVACLIVLQVGLAGPWGSRGALLARAAGLALGALLAAVALRRGAIAAAGSRLLGHRLVWALLDAGLVVVALGLAAARPRPPQAAARASGPSVLLVSIDTLRADFLGAYGRAEARTPVLDGLAAAGVRFDHAICQSVITGPSHATMLTGLLPTHHGVIENLRPLPAAIPTLAEAFGAAGYDTGAIVGGYPLKRENLGVLDRFAAADDRFHPTQVLPPAFFRTALARGLVEGLRAFGVELAPHARPADRVSDAAVAWLAGARGPFFCFVHYFDPHLPFDAPVEFESAAARAWTGPGHGRWHQAPIAERVSIIRTPGAMEQMARLYDAEVAFADRELGRTVAAARERAGDAGLWILVTSDHGESKGERDRYFERTLYDDTLRVPLILVPPAGTFAAARGRVIGGQARTLDVAPTLLDACGLADAFAVDGVSLLPSLAPDGPAPNATSLTAILDQSRVEMAVRTPAWKAIWREGYWNRNVYAWDPEERELYDLAADPGESRDRAAELPDRWEGLAARLDELRAARPDRDSTALDPEQLRALKALGYAH